ncbi:MAG: methyltransferase domain-containing protein [Anaerolineae bacterium]|nr:methyltransferase domain-containing protein [Anaerolineae bacterium]
MTDYLQPVMDWRDPAFMTVFDEVPLWSAMFGLPLLERVPMRQGMTVLDLACGAGFPLLDLAQRLGPTGRAYGLDGWLNGLSRAQHKIRALGIPGVALAGGDGAAMPFAGARFDLIISNLGINNFADAGAVLAECRRVIRPGGTLALATNLRGHMAAFYAEYARALEEMGRAELLPALEAHISQRATAAGIRARLEAAGWRVVDVLEDTLTMRYLDGTALLNHAFIRIAFMEGWYEFLPEADRAPVFARLEANLNQRAAAEGGLALTVPRLYIAAEGNA